MPAHNADSVVSLMNAIAMTPAVELPTRVRARALSAHLQGHHHPDDLRAIFEDIFGVHRRQS